MPRWSNVWKFGYEPGSVYCTDCGHRDQDAWDPSPEGFTNVDDYIYCDSCAELEKKDKGSDSGNR